MSVPTNPQIISKNESIGSEKKPIDHSSQSTGVISRNPTVTAAFQYLLTLRSVYGFVRDQVSEYRELRKVIRDDERRIYKRLKQLEVERIRLLKKMIVKTICELNDTEIKLVSQFPNPKEIREKINVIKEIEFPKGPAINEPAQPIPNEKEKEPIRPNVPQPTRRLRSLVDERDYLVRYYRVLSDQKEQMDRLLATLDYDKRRTFIHPHEAECRTKCIVGDPFGIRRSIFVDALGKTRCEELTLKICEAKRNNAKTTS